MRKRREKINNNNKKKKNNNNKNISYGIPVNLLSSIDLIVWWVTLHFLSFNLI